MNGANATPQSQPHPQPHPHPSNIPASQRVAKPPPMGPAPPAPTGAPAHTHNHPPPAKGAPPASHAPNHAHLPPTNGAPKGKKKAEPSPVDPVAVYESVKNRIAVLEEEEVHEEQEERQYAEEAQKSVKGMQEDAIQKKYVELFADYKRLERDHQKEKQKLTKDKDNAKSQLTKANQTKSKMENLARELQKDNKRLREDSKKLAQSVEEAQDEILQLKNDMTKRADKAKAQDAKFREQPDIVVKVICRYRAELFFKISRKTKLSRLFNAWTDRMEGVERKLKAAADTTSKMAPFVGHVSADGTKLKSDTLNGAETIQFMFTHAGRSLDPEQTPEEAGVEDGDEVLAVELMDLTEGPAGPEWSEVLASRRPKLKKNWTSDPREAEQSLEEMFECVVRQRLKEVLRQYELRERHFECVIRSKELEVLLARARAAEHQKQPTDSQKARSSIESTGMPSAIAAIPPAQTGTRKS